MQERENYRSDFRFGSVNHTQTLNEFFADVKQYDSVWMTTHRGLIFHLYVYVSVRISPDLIELQIRLIEESTFRKRFFISVLL